MLHQPSSTSCEMERPCQPWLRRTKTGQLFVLHREKRCALFPVEERKVPASTVPGEGTPRGRNHSRRYTRVQPTPFHRGRGVRHHPGRSGACKEITAGLRNEGIFTPPSLEGTLVIPSNIGGAHWGGVAADENQSGIVVVPVNRVAAMVQLIPAKGSTSPLPEGNRAVSAKAMNTR